MRPDDPRHGTYAGATAHYKEGEPPCEPCAEAKRIVNRRNKKNRRRGWQGLVPATPIRAHIDRLRKAGHTLESIAAAAGVGKATVAKIAAGESQSVLASTAVKLSVVDERSAPERFLVPVYRVRRRLQALQALGWSLNEVAARSGWSPQNLVTLIDDRWRDRETVSRDTFNTIDTAYRDLCMKPPPENRWTKATRNRATRHGWVPPLAWDDIDDQNERPTGVRDTTRTLPTTEHRAEVLTTLDAAGRGITEACRTLDVSREALEKWCDRHDMRPLFNRLTGRETAVFEYRNGATGAA